MIGKVYVFALENDMVMEHRLNAMNEWFNECGYLLRTIKTNDTRCS